MNIASIDIGTNTVLLLIAGIENGKLITYHNEYRIPRIGKGVSQNNPISEEKIEQLLSVLNEYSQLIKKFNCEVVLANATNAMRIASNRSEIIQKVKDKFGIIIKIIQGSEEARFSYLGAISKNKSEKEILVIDIGGGSTEIIFGINEKILYSKSFQIGAVSLTEKFLKNNPPDKIEIDNAINEIHYIFNELKSLKYSPETAIGIAGTPTTLAAINLSLESYDEENIDGFALTKDKLEIYIKKLSLLSSEEILNTYSSVVKGREDVLLAGTIILFHLLEINKLNELSVSSRGIRYGAVIGYANKNKLLT